MDLFISYPSERIIEAENIHSFLTSLGITSFFDKERLLPGQDWEREIELALQQSNAVILLCSKETFTKPGIIQREIKLILDQVKKMPLGQIFLLPIRLEEIRLPHEISMYQYLDYFSDHWQVRLTRSLISVAERQGNSTLCTHLEEWLKTQDIPTDDIPYIQKLFEDEKKFVLNCEYPTYPESNNLYLKFVNSVIYSEVLGRYLRFKSTFTNIDSPDDQQFMKPEFEITVEEFFRSNEIVSLRFFYFYYVHPSPYPNYGVFTKNFLGPMSGHVTLDDLFDCQENFVNSVLTYCTRVLSAEDGERSDTLGGSSLLRTCEDIAEKIHLLSQFNFDDQGITFNFSSYAVLPHAFGVREVHVPWEFFEGFVREEQRVSLAQLLSPQTT